MTEKSYFPPGVQGDVSDKTSDLHPVRSHVLQLLALLHSPFNYEYTNELIHWSGQYSQDPITFPKLRL